MTIKNAHFVEWKDLEKAASVVRLSFLRGPVVKGSKHGVFFRFSASPDLLKGPARTGQAVLREGTAKGNLS